MSIDKIIEQRREQFNLARVSENLSPLSAYVQSFFSEGKAYFAQQTGDPARSQMMTLQSLADLYDKRRRASISSAKPPEESQDTTVREVGLPG
jgi:hypothetical protein